MAYALTQNREDALELVQDSMLKLVQHYADRPEAEWRKLFFKILQNRGRDFYRRQKVQRLFGLFLPRDESCERPIEQARDSIQPNPQQNLEQSNSLQHINEALQQLPLRQQQTFLLRAWQEFSVKETADLLSISEGSVKTHYSRALLHLRQLLGDSA